MRWRMRQRFMGFFRRTGVTDARLQGLPGGDFRDPEDLSGSGAILSRRERSTVPIPLRGMEEACPLPKGSSIPFHPRPDV